MRFPKALLAILALHSPLVAGDCPLVDAGLEALGTARAACAAELEGDGADLAACKPFEVRVARLQQLMNDPETRHRLTFAGYISAHETLIEALAFQSRLLDHKLGRGR